MNSTTHRATERNSNATVASAYQSTNNDNGTDHAKQKASSAAKEARQTATGKAEELKKQANSAAETAKAKAIETAERAKDSGRQYAYEKKARAAEEIGVFSGAIRKAADKLEDEQHSSIASYVECAADQLDQVRTSLDDKRIGEIVDEVQDFTRRRPEVVYGGLFVAGLAAMRFLKASAPTTRNSVSSRSDFSKDSQRPATAFGHPPTRATMQQPVPVEAVVNQETNHGPANNTHHIGGLQA